MVAPRLRGQAAPTPYETTSRFLPSWNPAALLPSYVRVGQNETIQATPETYVINQGPQASPGQPQPAAPPRAQAQPQAPSVRRPSVSAPPVFRPAAIAAPRTPQPQATGAPGSNFTPTLGSMQFNTPFGVGLGMQPNAEAPTLGSGNLARPEGAFSVEPGAVLGTSQPPAQPAAPPPATSAPAPNFSRILQTGLDEFGNRTREAVGAAFRPSNLLGGMRPASLILGGLATLAAPTSQAAQIAATAPGQFEESLTAPAKRQADLAATQAETTLHTAQAEQARAAAGELRQRPQTEAAKETGRMSRAEMQAKTAELNRIAANERAAASRALTAQSQADRNYWSNQRLLLGRDRLALQKELAANTGNQLAGLTRPAIQAYDINDFKSLWSGIPPQLQQEGWKTGLERVARTLPAAQRPAFLRAFTDWTALGNKVSPEKAALVEKYLKQVMAEGTEHLSLKSGSHPDYNTLPPIDLGNPGEE